MAQTSIRDRQALDTRTRIAATALDLFSTQGYAETTIDQIAVEAGVSRRTVFRHFPTKEAMVFDHLAVGRDFIIQRLGGRPSSEPLLRSLFEVLRELCERGFERRLLEQIHAVLALNPRFAAQEFSVGFQAFEQNITAVLESRPGRPHSQAEVQALTQMAEGWFLVAVRLFFKEGERTLAEYFDHVVEICSGALAAGMPPVTTSSRPRRKPDI